MLCDPTVSSLPGSSVHGIPQARLLEWIAMTFSRRSSWSKDQTCISYVSWIAGGFFSHWATWEALIPVWSEVKSLSRVQLFATPWTVAYQAPQSMGFSRQEYWSGLPFPSPGDLPNPGIEPGSPTLQADALPSEPPGKPQRQLLTFQNLSSTFLWEPFDNSTTVAEYHKSETRELPGGPAVKTPPSKAGGRGSGISGELVSELRSHIP